jgi:hypothetical protein
MAHKTKESALKAARKALGATATEGLQFVLRNTGAGWEFEAVPEAPPKGTKAPRKAKAVTRKANITQAQADAAVRSVQNPKRAPRRKLADAVAPKPKGEQPTKTELVMGLIRRPSGATSKQIEEATGWAPHSVRGLLGTFRASGVKVESTKEKGQPTVYRVRAGAEVEDVI